jgi:two-component system chemotaxis sensor kinase CheA
VDALKLDSLLDSASNLLVTSSRVAERRADLEALHDLAARSAQEWRRAARRLRLALERSGAPATAVQTVSAVDESLRRVARDSGRLASGLEADARALSLASGEVADRARGLRMRPFAEACEALPRAVRDLADAAGKEVRLAVTGGEVEMDRAVLDGLREALLHLVRNAVDHGIEPPAARQAAGKPRGGLVTVAAALRGDRVVVTVADDGAGLNLPAIKHQLARRGLPIPTQDRDLIRALFESGLSTRAEATPISGRGVGLDIVRAATERIRGGVSVSWEAGRGTTFTLDCPPTLAVIRALLVAVGRDIVAIPVSNVERLLRLSPGAIRQAEGRDVIATDEGPVPLVALARLLPPLVERPVTDKVYAVLLNAGGLRLALAVDELLVEQEAVMRPVGRKPLPRVSGAVLLGSGKVALVLDAQAAVLAGLAEVGGPGVKVAAAAAAPARRRVLVVDDSITTRALEQSILEAAGYDVLTAVDGSEAWRALLEHGADLVVADVEMPRMDGFALCEAIRGSKRFKELPIVLVTAMETPEHRARGLEVGADAYIGKSSFDQQGLLDTIRQLLGS